MKDHTEACLIVTEGICTCNGLPVVEWHRHDKDVTYRPDSIVLTAAYFNDNR